MTSEFKQQTILITGGGSGIGLAIAHTFADEGAKVVITGRNKQRLEAACTEIGPNAVFRVHDVAAIDTIATLVSSLESEIGPINCLINNAGGHNKASFTEVLDEDVENVIDINLKGAFALSRECARYMAPRGEGSILMISSMAALLGIPKVSAYSMTKAGLLGLTRSLATDLGADSIRVNAICPGFIDTPMFRKATDNDPQRKNRILARTPLAEFGKPQDIADAALFLASKRARFITGTALPVDGGFSIGF